MSVGPKILGGKAEKQPITRPVSVGGIEMGANRKNADGEISSRNGGDADRRVAADSVFCLRHPSARTARWIKREEAPPSGVDTYGNRNAGQPEGLLQIAPGEAKQITAGTGQPVRHKECNAETNAGADSDGCPPRILLADFVLFRPSGKDSAQSLIYSRTR